VINDAPSALLGLNEADIHRVLEEKITFALNNLALPDDIVSSQRKVKHDNGARERIG